MAHISHADAENVRLKGRLARIREDGSEMVQTVACAAITFTGAAVSGYAHGRMGTMRKVFGVPATAIASGLLFAGALFAGKRFRPYLVAAAQGPGAYQTGFEFAKIGRRHREEKGEAAKGPDGKPITDPKDGPSVFIGGGRPMANPTIVTHDQVFR